MRHIISDVAGACVVINEPNWHMSKVGETPDDSVIKDIYAWATGMYVCMCVCMYVCMCVLISEPNWHMSKVCETPDDSVIKDIYAWATGMYVCMYVCVCV
jgi:hypothetical protein